MFQVLSDQLKQALLGVGRKPQTVIVGPEHALVESRMGKLLRVHVQVVYEHDDVKDAVVNPIEFQRAGAVSVLWDDTKKKMAVVQIRRPIVPDEHVTAYLRAWDTHLGGEQRDVVAFGEAVVGLLGHTHWQLTQSYGYAPETIEATGLRAAEDQGGMFVTNLKPLGFAYTDTSNRADRVDYFLATVDPSREPAGWATKKEKPTVCDKLWVDEREFLALTLSKEKGIPTSFAHSAYTLMKANNIW